MRDVLIVGGGSAGWICAAYLNAALNRANKKRVQITLVESPRIGRLGVGEATVPTIRHVLQTVGLDEKSFMKATDATFKQAIRFDNWLYEKDTGYYHPFDRRNTGSLDRSGEDWVSSDRSVSFAHTVTAQTAFCDLGLSPKLVGSKDFATPMPYAYHMDAEKFADYLCDVATKQGVRHYVDTVKHVETFENGAIKHIDTEGGLTLAADLFVDCTGFASVLIGKTLGVSLTSYAPWLMCDRAVAMRVPYQDYFSGHVRPFTSATALSSGWVWDIGLANRRGRGYVYSSAHISDDDAEAELRRVEGAHADNIEARRLRFYVGARQRQWEKNCIAVGLAGGFIEPLESTGLYLVEYASIALAEHFPRNLEAMPIMADRFNTIMTQRYEEILDFVNLHYCLTKRTDTPFWQDAGAPNRITDRLKSKLEFWSHKSPSAADFDDHLRLFSYQSYEHILYGMEADIFGDKGVNATKIPEQITAITNAGKSRLPSHKAWLELELSCAFPG